MIGSHPRVASVSWAPGLIEFGRGRWPRRACACRLAHESVGALGDRVARC